MLVAFSIIFNFEQFSGCKVPGWNLHMLLLGILCRLKVLAFAPLQLSPYPILRYLRSGLERGFHLQTFWFFSCECRGTQAKTCLCAQQQICVKLCVYSWVWIEFNVAVFVLWRACMHLEHLTVKQVIPESQCKWWTLIKNTWCTKVMAKGILSYGEGYSEHVAPKMQMTGMHKTLDFPDKQLASFAA